LCILMLLAFLMVPDWNSDSSKLIPHLHHLSFA
jgi:hypothetical protein